LGNLLEVLRRADVESGVRQQALDTMRRQLSQLVRLVDDLLELSRITHDRLELRKRPVAIEAVIQQAIESCRPLAEAAGHRIRTTMPSRPIHVHADEARLVQVLSNLVNNSCKYTNSDGEIAVVAERDANDVVITVSDNGIGIPPEKLGDIFDMFMQIERTAERSQGGLGIGLTLVKRLVRMHGGTVEAKSAGTGRGSEFVVRLPAMPEHVSAESTPVPAARQPLAPRRILVVDDNRDAATSLAMLLQMAGHATHVAHDGLTAIESLDRHRPDVLLLDIGLPGLNGYEVCRRVRQQPWGKEIVVVALTGWGQERDRQESRDAGFDGHLVKPVEYGSLMDLLQSLASRGAAAGEVSQA
jgi:CheY-like chemotaxis protein